MIVQDPYGNALICLIVIPFAFFVGSALLLFVSLLLRSLWAWMDDSKLCKCPLLRVWAAACGWKYIWDDYFDERRWKKGSRTVNQDEFIGGYFGACTLLGLLVGIYLLSAGVALGVILAIALAFLTRFTRRLAKAYKSHTEDKNAHR